MKFVFFTLLLLSVAACNKQQKLKRLEGTWKLNKILRINGTFDTLVSEVYSFTKTNASGGDFSIINTKFNSIKRGAFKLKSNGSYIHFMDTVKNSEIKKSGLEDVSENELILRDDREILFFSK